MDKDARNDPIPAGESQPRNEQEPPSQDSDSRRVFLRETVKKAAYAAPLVLLFKPRAAIAESPNGSVITDTRLGKMGKWA